MTRHRILLALAATASLAMPGTAQADDDDDSRILRGFVAPHYHGSFWDRDDDDDRGWEFSYRIRHDDDDDRWDDDDDDDDDDRWDDDD